MSLYLSEIVIASSVVCRVGLPMDVVGMWDVGCGLGYELGLRAGCEELQWSAAKICNAICMSWVLNYFSYQRLIV